VIRRIDEINVGPRFRKEMGDIARLAARMGELGLLQPIVISPDGAIT
jgi:ParB family chromosome partitioning protein